MTTHELARALLEGPDMLAIVEWGEHGDQYIAKGPVLVSSRSLWDEARDIPDGTEVCLIQ